jgi:hypothetical protein
VGDCLVFQGSGPREYGTFRSTTSSKDSKVYVHRWVYETTIGPIPPGYDIDHVAARGCKFKRCINPSHLEPVTHVENQRRARLTVCRSGRHDLTNPTNQRWDSRGRRRGCLTCWLEGQGR